MAYNWVRPVASPQSAPNWATNAGQGWPFWSLGVPPQYLTERPCPLYVGCATVDAWKWLDPVYAEYRDAAYPEMGAWPPPQPGPSYDTWLAQNRQWMPYEVMAYSGIVPETPCAETLGLPLAENTAQWLRFDFAASADWPFVTTWSGIRVVVQVNKHKPVTNEGSCSQTGKARLVVGLYRHSADYPALPATWNAADFTSQEFEFNNFGVGNYVNPYGAGVANVVVDFPTPPGGGPWLVAEEKRYWVVIGQELSEQGKLNGSDNQILSLRKCWAASIATLGGSPGSTSPNTVNVSVQG